MDVWIVIVCVHHRLMAVWMRVRLARWIVWRMRVPMVFIMHVQMLVLHLLVPVFVFVTLGNVQPHA